MPALARTLLLLCTLVWAVLGGPSAQGSQLMEEVVASSHEGGLTWNDHAVSHDDRASVEERVEESEPRSSAQRPPRRVHNRKDVVATVVRVKADASRRIPPPVGHERSRKPVVVWGLSLWADGPPLA